MSRALIGLLRAVTDPRLLGVLELWPRQKELLASVEAGPRMHVQALGRRSSKSTMAALFALWQLLFRPDLDAMVRPGETRYAVCVATNLKTARLVIAAARSIVEASPTCERLLKSHDLDELRFELPDGSRCALRAVPCNARGIRGMPISCLIFDELAFFMSDTEGPAVAEQIAQALIPATAQFGDKARILALSTPYGTDGLFADWFTKASTGELPDAVAVQAATAEVNPTIDQAFLDLERARDPHGYLSEYEARFEGSGGSFIDFDLVAEEPARRGPLDPDACERWVAGLDPATAQDLFGLAIVGVSREHPGRLLVGRVAGLDPKALRAAGEGSGSFEASDARRDALLAQVVEILAPYKPQCVTDQHLAHGVRSALARAGLHTTQHNMTATSKTLVFEELRSRMYGGTLELYDVPALMSELRRLRMRHTAGASSVVNPRVGGSHGDMAQALALAVYELRHARASGNRWRPREPLPKLDGEQATQRWGRNIDRKYGPRLRSGFGGFEA